MKYPILFLMVFSVFSASLAQAGDPKNIEGILIHKDNSCIRDYVEATYRNDKIERGSKWTILGGLVLTVIAPPVGVSVMGGALISTGISQTRMQNRSDATELLTSARHEYVSHKSMSFWEQDAQLDWFVSKTLKVALRRGMAHVSRDMIVAELAKADADRVFCQPATGKLKKKLTPKIPDLYSIRGMRNYVLSKLDTSASAPVSAQESNTDFEDDSEESSQDLLKDTLTQSDQQAPQSPQDSTSASVQ